MEKRAYEQRHHQPQHPHSGFPSAVKEAAPPALVKTIGGTTFDIHIHFSETSKETFTDKVLRLIQNDSVTD